MSAEFSSACYSGPPMPISGASGKKERAMSGSPVSVREKLKLGYGDRITSGHGEYVVYHSAPTGIKTVSQFVYEAVYEIFNEYSPDAILSRCERETVKRGITKFEAEIKEAAEGTLKPENVDEVAGKAAAEQFLNRYELMRKRIKEIDPSLEIAFIPKALYELIFIRKSIQEDLNTESRCLRQGGIGGYKMTSEEELAFYKNNRCWHIKCFPNTGDDQAPRVKQTAYRLNQIIVRLIPKHAPEAFSFGIIAKIAKKEIAFFKQHAANYKSKKIDLAKCLASEPSFSVPLSNFGIEHSASCSFRAMSIYNEQTAQIVRNAIALECSTIAQSAFILYRGSNFNVDTPYDLAHPHVPYSLSYGTGLFSGAIYDGGANPFFYMRRGDGHAMAVPIEDMHRSIFHIPPTSTICQLIARGESFHARTKAWKGVDLSTIRGGIDGGMSASERLILQCELEREHFIAQFHAYKEKAILLKLQEK